MKKYTQYLFLFVSLLMWTGIVYGQNKEQKNTTPLPVAYTGGISANMPFVTAYTDTFSARTGWGAWGYAEYDLKNGFKFLPGIAYNSFGFNQYFYNDSGVIQRRKITEHYFDIMARFSYIPGGYENGIRINAGIGVSLLAERKADIPDELGRNITQITIDKKKSLSPGLLLSFGLSTPLGKKFEAGVNYTQGLPSHIYPRDIIGRTGTLQITIGYRLVPNKLPQKGISETQTQLIEVPEEPLYKQDSLVLLVRLKENHRRIHSLLNDGLLNDALTLEEETKYENMQICEAFKQEFNQLPVFYFYDTDSKAILAGERIGILLDSNLKRDSSIFWPQKQVFFAEFATRFDEASQTSGMYGLVVYLDNFKEVPPPFPAFVSNSYGFLSKKEVLTRYNKKIAQYFEEQKRPVKKR